MNLPHTHPQLRTHPLCVYMCVCVARGSQMKNAAASLDNKKARRSQMKNTAPLLVKKKAINPLAQQITLPVKAHLPAQKPEKRGHSGTVEDDHVKVRYHPVHTNSD